MKIVNLLRRYRRVLGDDDAVDSLMGNLQEKSFCQNAGETNEWAAKLLGERWQSITGTGSVNQSQQRRYYVDHPPLPP